MDNSTDKSSFQWDDAKNARVIELDAAGWSLSRIAEAIGCPSINAVSGRIGKLGLRQLRGRRDNATERVRAKSVAESFWTDEKIAAAVRLKAEGLSHSEIAGELGTTKGSVQGKMRRLGFSEQKANKGKLYVARKRQILAANGNPHLPPGAVPLLALRATHCRWPVTDRPPHLFCAQPRWGSSSYCACHSAKAWRREV